MILYLRAWASSLAANNATLIAASMTRVGRDFIAHIFIVLLYL